MGRPHITDSRLTRNMPNKEQTFSYFKATCIKFAYAEGFMKEVARLTGVFSGLPKSVTISSGEFQKATKIESILR